MTLPPIPRSVWSPLGRVPISLVPDLKSVEGEEVLGLFVFDRREIKLKAGLPLVVLWATLRHEMVHLWLWDAGVTLSEEQEERVADVLGTALTAEMVHGNRRTGR